MTAPLVLKLGGELIETAASRTRLARAVRRLASVQPLVVIHGGGRAVDDALAQRQITPKKVDGLRITDIETLEVVVAVLAGSTNTALVAGLVASGVKAVGLTGVDAGLGAADRTASHRAANGSLVDLGLVGDPDRVDPALLWTLLRAGYVPVIASIGLERGGSTLLNVNADVMACRVAAALGAHLVIAGATSGVLDGAGQLIPAMTSDDVDRLVGDGTATAGMIAKLAACRAALDSGVPDVRIIDGRVLDGGMMPADAPGTLLVAAVSAS